MLPCPECQREFPTPQGRTIHLRRAHDLADLSYAPKQKTPEDPTLYLKCGDCGDTLPVDRFSKKSSSTRGYCSRCKDCHNRYNRTRWYPNNASKQQTATKRWKADNKAALAATKYAVPEAEVEELHEISCCEICGDSTTTLNIDHDHTSGLVRGRLCTRCNTGLGLFRDSTDLLIKAAQYLKRPPHQERRTRN